MTDALSAIPGDVRCLADYQRHAQGVLPPETWRHIQEGAAPESPPSCNRASFDRFRFVPRVMTDLRDGTTAVTMFRTRHAAPILLAPLAYHRIAHPEGELATVRAAMALQTGMIVSTLSSVPLEDIAVAARQAAADMGTPVAPLWFQLYLQEDRAWNVDLVQRAEAAGYSAIVLTVDASVKRSSFILPAGVDAANLRGMPRLSQTSVAGGRILFGTALMNAAPRWEDLAWLRAQTRLPLILKGVLSSDDAARAIDMGCDGVIVSNHGGRVLDGLASPVEMMPAIAEVVAGRVPLLLDGDVRKGGDIVKALALGATAVLVGRAQMHALAVAGMAGVAHMLHILRTDLEFTMAQIGCATPGAIGIDRLIGPADRKGSD